MELITHKNVEFLESLSENDLFEINGGWGSGNFFKDAGWCFGYVVLGGLSLGGSLVKG